MPDVAEIFESMEYGPAPESRERVQEWLDTNGRRFGHFIDGHFTDPAESERFETVAPATGQPIAEVAQGTIEDVDRAVAAARRALKGWRGLSGHERARYLYAIARRIQRGRAHVRRARDVGQREADP